MPLTLKSVQGGDAEPKPETAAKAETAAPSKKQPRRNASPRKKPAVQDAAVFIATQSGTAEGKKGDSYVFVKGVTRVAKGHELLRLCPDYFEPVADAVHYGVEQATAGPGEQR